MRWHIARNGQVIETADEATIREWARRGQLTPDLYLQAEAGGPWIPVGQSPFGSAASKPKNSVAMLLLGVAAVLMSCALLAWAGDKAEPKRVSGPARAPVATTQGVTAPAAETAVAKAASPTSPAPVEAGPEPNRPHLGVSKSSLRATFEKFGIVLKSSPLADGTPRLLGNHPDKLSTFEVYGHGDRAEGASLTMGLAQDAPVALRRNTLMLVVFMRETGWAQGHTWASDRLTKGGGKITKNGVAYEVIDVGGTGLFVLVAKPAPAGRKL